MTKQKNFVRGRKMEGSNLGLLCRANAIGDDLTLKSFQPVGQSSASFWN